jgi:hypothetical protein
VRGRKEDKSVTGVRPKYRERPSGDRPISPGVLNITTIVAICVMMQDTQMGRRSVVGRTAKPRKNRNSKSGLVAKRHVSPLIERHYLGARGSPVPAAQGSGGTECLDMITQGASNER